MKVPNKILIDADAMVALVNPDDPSHAIAEKLGGEIDGRGVKVIISDPAFGEALTVISQDTSLEKAILFAERNCRGGFSFETCGPRHSQETNI